MYAEVFTVIKFMKFGIFFKTVQWERETVDEYSWNKIRHVEIADMRVGHNNILFVHTLENFYYNKLKKALKDLFKLDNKNTSDWKIQIKFVSLHNLCILLLTLSQNQNTYPA